MTHKNIFIDGYIDVDENPPPHTHTPNGSLTGKEGNVLFNDSLNTFYLRLYGVGHIVKDHSDTIPQKG